LAVACGEVIPIQEMARKEWRERRGSNQSQTPAFPKEKPRKPAPVNKILHLASMNVFTMMDLIGTPFFVSFVSMLLRACARVTCFQTNGQDLRGM
jgi:hypothetical protein